MPDLIMNKGRGTAVSTEVHDWPEGAPPPVSLYLIVRFATVAAPDVSLTGILKEYSVSQISFFSRSRLSAGEMITISVCTSGEALTCSMPIPAKVMRCNPDGEHFAVVVELHKVQVKAPAHRPEAHGSLPEAHDPRRKAIRRATNMHGMYRCSADGRFHPCHALEISAGGVRLITTERLKSEKKIFVRMEPEHSGAHTKAVLAEAIVLWCHVHDRSSFESGCRFSEVHVRDI